MAQQLYELPEGWAWREISSVCGFLNGYAFKSKDYTDNGHFLVRIGNVQDGCIVLDNPRYTAIPSGQERFSLEAGDMLMSLTGNIGRVGIIQDEHLPAALNQRVAKVEITDNSALLQEFVFLFFSSSLFREEIVKHSHGAAQKNVSTKDISIIYLPLPPIDEQKRIVAKLDALFTRIDTAITHLQETLKLSKALFSSALDGCIDPAWELTVFDDIKVSNVIGLVRSVDQQDASLSFPYVKMNNITRDGEMDLSDYVRVDCDADEADKFSLSSGDFLFNTRNSAELVGKTAVFEAPNDESARWLFNNNIMRVRFRSDVNPYFVRYLFQSSEVKARLEALKSNTTNVSAIYYKKLKALLLPIPSHDEQLAMRQYLDSLSERTRILEAETQERLDQLTALKSSLLDAAFRGQL